MKLVLTCEHGGNLIPSQFQHLFKEAQPVLESHRGYDLGALDLFYHLEPLASFSYFSEVSRLLVELNRSLNHSRLFSEYTGTQPAEVKRTILTEYYFPYRKAVEKQLSDLLLEGEKVLHLSVHSFTPELNGQLRNTDIGLLYDPKRKSEKEFCETFKKELGLSTPAFKVRYNYPYLGIADGFITYLRKRFPDNYCGIELEVNQKFCPGNKMELEMKRSIYRALKNCLLQRS